MIRRFSLPFVILLAVGGLAATLVAGNHPQLGLDLQGGAYVVLRPDRAVSSGVLDQSIEIIRSRVDALGVAEPDISRQGDSIIVQLPGVKDQQRALEIVGQTAELRFRPVLAVLGADETGVTTTTSTTSTTVAGAAAGDTTSTTVDPAATTVPPTTVPAGTTARDDDIAEQEVVLPQIEDGRVISRFRLGPAGATGTIVSSAKATPPSVSADWTVDVDLTGDGNELFNTLATSCFNRTAECPTGLVAIVLDSIVQSAPEVQQATFPGGVEITGTFTEREARSLALVLEFGALPVQLTPQSTQTVSATLGQDSLRAGIIAGLLGLGLVMIYMILYYRALGIVVVIGLAVTGMLLWSLVSYLGTTTGLALTLAGSVGIIVSVGVTVDSYVVFFERLRDDIRAGKTLRSSVDRSFGRAYRTIVAADISSLIGAGLLYFLTVGSVRGFAFFLGVSALLDLFVAYFFTRPMVAWLGRHRAFSEAPFFGVSRGLAESPA